VTHHNGRPSYLDPRGIVHRRSDSGSTFHITACERDRPADLHTYHSLELAPSDAPATCFVCLVSRYAVQM
jgi:hypothetical protein